MPCSMQESTMVRYTTPTDTYRVLGVDLTGCNVWVSYQQGARELDVETDAITYDGEDSIVEVELTQAQTAAFREGRKLLVQVNWVYPTGKRDATVQAEVDVMGNLLERELTYD